MALTAGIVGLPNVGNQLFSMQLQKRVRKLLTILSRQLIQTSEWLRYQTSV